jgi:hypothetical protein
MKDPLPQIDFSQKLILGILGGEHPAGTTITLGRVEQMEDVMYAPYRFNSPAPSSAPIVVASSDTAPAVIAAPAAPTTPAHPYLLVLVPRVDMKIRLTQKETSQ